MESWFALHCVRRLSNHEARNHSQAFHSRTPPPRARCLTATLPPNGGGPRRHRGFTNATVGVAWPTRARVHPSTRANGSVPTHRCGFTNARRARVRHRKMAAVAENWFVASSLRSSIHLLIGDWPLAMTEVPASPSRHQLRKCRPGSARALGEAELRPGLGSFPAAALADAMASPGSRSLRNRKLPRPARKPTGRARAKHGTNPRPRDFVRPKPPQ